jgi:inner membrane protein
MTPKPYAKKPISVIWKMIAIGSLTLLLLIPLFLVSGIVGERESLSRSVDWDIARTWGEEQTIIGPLLAIPYVETVQKRNDKGVLQTENIAGRMYLLPKTLQADIQLNPEIRYRGIYQTLLYTSNIQAEGAYDLTQLKPLETANRRILWEEAFIALHIPHLQGIRSQPEMTLSGAKQEFFPGVHQAHFLNSGLHAPVKLATALDPEKAKNLPFRLSLSLNGSGSFSIAPVGEQNTFNMNSPWPTPSFIGHGLPDTRTITEEGFSASWEIPYFSRNYDQTFLESNNPLNNIQASTVGTSLLIPVDFYKQSQRAVKYGILFIVLTFATFFLFEVLCRQPVHPFQYLMVGCALVLFFLLLISLSEVIQFAWAYVVASVAIVMTITLYSKTMLGRISRSAPLVLGALLAALYGYLYILLQLEDLSLLFGSIGLFVVLAVIMYVTRNINWYHEHPPEKEPGPSPISA